MRTKAKLADTEAIEGLIVRRRQHRALVVSLYGELDLASMASLQQTLDAAIAEQPLRLVVDLSGVRFMDCSGLRALMQAAQTCRARGIRLDLRRASRPVSRLLELTGITEPVGADG